MLHGYVITCLDAYVHTINIFIMMRHKGCVYTNHIDCNVLLMTTLPIWILCLQLVQLDTTANIVLEYIHMKLNELDSRLKVEMWNM